MDSRGTRFVNLWQPVAALRVGLLPLKEDGRLQSCRFGGLDAWMPGCQEAWRLEAWILEPWRLVGLLAGWLAGLDCLCGAPAAVIDTLYQDQTFLM